MLKNFFVSHKYFDYITINISSGYQIIEINQVALRIFRWKKSEVIGKDFYELCKKHKIQNPMPHDSSWLKNNKPLQGIETKITNKRKIKIIQWKIYPQSKKNLPEGMILVGNDITKQRELEDRIYELDNIIAQMPENVYWYNKDHIYLGCNENSAKTLGMSREEAIGKNFKTLMRSVRGISRKAVNQWIQDGIDVMETKAAKFNIEEAPFIGPNNKMVDMITNKVPLLNKNGELYGVLGISTDITERKRAEEREKAALMEAAAARAREAKAEAELRQAVMILSGSIAHDLRTPIFGLEAQGHIIQKYWPILIDAYRKAKQAQLPIEGDNQKIEKGLHLIAEVGNNFERTIKEIHQFIDATLKTLSKTVNSELKQEDLVPCSIWHCLFNALERYPFSAQQRQLIKWKQQYNFEFMGNEILFIRMIFNLLNNALQQIEKNQHGEIFISNEDGNDVNILRVKDTAGGIPLDIIPHLFDGYRTTKETGTGLGLAFCKQTMRNFGGNIVCNSIYGEFAEFILYFPKVLFQKILKNDL